MHRYIWQWLIPFVYFLMATFLGVLLAYLLTQVLGGVVPYHKLVNKCTLLVLLLGIYPVMKHLRWQAADLGFAADRALFFGQLMRGFGLGVAIMSVMIFALLVLDIRVVDEEEIVSLSNILVVAAKALLVGLLVGMLEEVLFRGVLFGSLRRSTGVIYAGMVSALFYAALHFLKPGVVIPVAEVSWWSGFQLIMPAFAALFRIEVLDSFLALFCVGIFLACVRGLIADSLGYCMGLHAGWVFVIKVSKSLTDAHPQSDWSFLVGNYNGIIGYGVAIWLLVLTSLMIYRNRLL